MKGKGKRALVLFSNRDSVKDRPGGGGHGEGKIGGHEKTGINGDHARKREANWKDLGENVTEGRGQARDRPTH